MDIDTLHRALRQRGHTGFHDTPWHAIHDAAHALDLRLADPSPQAVHAALTAIHVYTRADHEFLADAVCLLVFDRVGDPCPWSEPTLAWHLCGLLRADGYHYGINSILAKIRKAKRTTYARTLAAMIVRMGNGVTAAAPVVLP